MWIISIFSPQDKHGNIGFVVVNATFIYLIKLFLSDSENNPTGCCLEKFMVYLMVKGMGELLCVHVLLLWSAAAAPSPPPPTLLVLKNKEWPCLFVVFNGVPAAPFIL